jgi:hypothetical protein
LNIKTILDNPYTTCSCPVGFIFCAHKGALLCLLQGVYEYRKKDSSADFEKIVSIFPEPAHTAVSNLIPVTSVYLPTDSEENKERNSFLFERKLQQTEMTLESREDNDDDEQTAMRLESSEDDDDDDDNEYLGLDGLEELIKEMESSAIPGVIDNSTTDIIPVIERT